MKLTKLALAASVAIGIAASSATAATLNVQNTDFALSGNDLMFLDNAGNPLASGFVALSTTPDISGIRNDSLVVLAGGNYPGGGVFASGLTAANDGALTGLNLFLIIGNNPNPALADQLGVINTGLAFTKPDVPPPPDSQDWFGTPGANVVLGLLGPVTVDATAIGGGPGYETTGLLLVPEPSSSLLFGLAGLTLLIRRKR